MEKSNSNNGLFLNIKLSRKRYLQAVSLALGVEEFRFAREAILEWLATYPGDLEAGLYYAQALLGEGRDKDAIPILSGLCIADPEYESAAKAWLEAEERMRGGLGSRSKRGQTKPLMGAVGDPIPTHLSLAMKSMRSYIYALTDEQMERDAIAGWGEDLRKTRLAIETDDLAMAEEHIRSALAAEPPLPLAVAYHLHYLEKAQAPSEARLELAKRYHRIWPDCLTTTLYLAHWSMEIGDMSMSVALLHQAAARDIGAQVAGRLWEDNIPYQDLWPSSLELPLRFGIPAKVSTLLGWNQLAGGASGTVDLSLVREEMGLNVSPHVDAMSSTVMEIRSSTLDKKSVEGETSQPASPETQADSGGVTQARQIETESMNADPDGQSKEGETLRQEVEEMANRYNLPGLTRLDGRFPVYIVFSMRSGLQSFYGRRAAAVIEKEMALLVETVQKLPGWGARLFLADDSTITTRLGIKPVTQNDPWALKLALADLDTALGARGEMIGALLIVGDPEVVPFHRLPNPLDDQDDDVPSDNPYATRDKNYFIPEWPVGRLPSGGDPRLLVKLLRRFRKVHNARLKKAPWYQKIIQEILDLLKVGKNGSKESFGYTAAIWREAAGAVFRPIGNPRGLQVSPPRGLYEGTFLNPVDSVEKQDGLEGGVPLPCGRFGYFNLHGLVDASEWFGQRDPLIDTNGPDYPVAIRPEDIERASNGKGDGLPQLVFSEACYGLHIQGKKIDEAIALKFLENGSLAVAGSTCMAYGSVEKPLIAADLLGHEFWGGVQDGLPAGEALRRAKISLANEMDNRQGYLDGEDQKTLVSFILYGDPLARPDNNAVKPKGVYRLATPMPELKTVCDRDVNLNGGAKAPADILASVHEVVSHYLPGMTDAVVAVSQPRTGCNGDGHCCPTSQLHASESIQSKVSKNLEKQYRLVTLSKIVPRTEGVHAHYARLTLDEHGELLKLVVSR